MDDTGVVIGTKNEERTIGYIVRSLPHPVVVVDSNSSDYTRIEAIRAGATVLGKQDEGIASAYITGFREALKIGFDRIVQMDAGMSHHPKDVPGMLGVKTDLVIGSRLYQWWGSRSLVTYAAGWLMRLKGVDVWDATSGFRVWDAVLLWAVIDEPVTSVGNAFQIELLWRAHKLGASVYEHPIEYRRTESHFKLWMLWEALKTYWRLG